MGSGGFIYIWTRSCYANTWSPQTWHCAQEMEGCKALFETSPCYYDYRICFRFDKLSYKISSFHTCTYIVKPQKKNVFSGKKDYTNRVLRAQYLHVHSYQVLWFTWKKKKMGKLIHLFHIPHPYSAVYEPLLISIVTFAPPQAQSSSFSLKWEVLYTS